MSNRKMQITAGALALAMGMSPTVQADEGADEVTRSGALGGRTSTPVWFSGPQAQPYPGWAVRAGMFSFNFTRMYPHDFGLVDMMGNPILPNPPALYSPYMVEAGRWQALHNATTGCNCTAEVVGYDPMDPATSENEKYVGATCCDMGVADGVAQCVGPLVTCKDDNATLRQERWAILNQGIAQVNSEQSQNLGEQAPGAADMFGFSVPNDGPLVGAAVNAGTNAMGIDLFKANAPPASCADDPSTPECQPDGWPETTFITIVSGRTQALTPTVTDGTHLPTQEDGATPFGVHYYEPGGEPAGEPNSVTLVVDGQCSEPEFVEVATTLPNTADVPAPYSGRTYIGGLTLPDGCHPYAFVVQDGDGFDHVWPDFGALQARVEGGVAVENDDACPIWVPERLDISCAPAAAECGAGETRPCYTGRAGTQEEGVCSVGQETCVNGRWGGTCDGEVTPEPEEVCGDDVDNDCNGGVDEGCPDDGNNDPGDGNNDPGTNNTNNTGGGTNNTGGGDGGGDGGSGDGDDSGCSQAAPAAPARTPLGLALVVLGFVAGALRRRR